MPTYNIYLGNPHRIRYRWRDLCFAVQALFNPVIANVSGYNKVMVYSRMDRPQMSPVELLCYVLPSPLEALVGPNFGNTFGGPSVGGLTGWNSNGAETGSEVYISENWGGPQRLAGVIYHEFLHNKLRWTDAQLHNHHALGLAPSPINPPQTAQDISLMAGALKTNRPQWLGGWDLVSDPLHGL